MAEEKGRPMDRANWVRVYHAYFQSMVVRGLSELAFRTLGSEVGFNVVAETVERGAMKGFKVLMEELSKEGLKLNELSLKELIRYEVDCHKYAVERMGVGFQVFEEAREEEPGRRYVLYTRNCKYHELAKKIPTVCGVCVGLTAGILRQAGYKVRWLSSPMRKKQLCLSKPGDRPEYVVYRDPGTKPPECKLVIEKLEC